MPAPSLPTHNTGGFRRLRCSTMRTAGWGVLAPPPSSPRERGEGSRQQRGLGEGRGRGRRGEGRSRRRIRTGAARGAAAAAGGVGDWFRGSTTASKLYGCEVVCFTADVGKGDIEMEGLEKKAKASGASQLVVKNLQEEFVGEYIFPYLRAGAVYERKYLLGTSMARPVIAKAMVDVAKEVGADAVAHGCTLKGNDQVCFELTFYALNPELKVVTP